jgi:hypothetical protein
MKNALRQRVLIVITLLAAETTAFAQPNRPSAQLISVRAGSPRTVLAFFDDGITAGTATNRTNYALQCGSDARIVPVAAAYDASRRRVALSFTNDFINGGRYTLYCNGLTNLAGIAVQPDTSGTFGLSNHVIRVSALTNNHAISPLVYGVAWAPSLDYLRDIGATVHRWGGNRASTYNWLVNASASGADWYFENFTRVNPENSYPRDAVEFAHDSAAAGAATLLSIPMLPFIAKDTNSVSFSVAKYGPQRETNPKNADAGNGISTNGAKIVNDPLDAGTTNTVAFQAQWLRHLGSNSVALPFIALDNEMEIWAGTHRDWHPAPVSYDEIWGLFTNYAPMVRRESPQSKILAPVTCAWWFYWNSDAGPADKAAHGGKDFLPWFLDMAHTNELQTGRRLLDVLDIHYYPDSFTGADDAARQLRSTRELWDATYTRETWSGDHPATPTQPNPHQPSIIPRFRELIAQHYPGTKLAITEYNWGAENTVPGMLALTDVLGIFGREDLYLATYWTWPPATTPAYNAFKLYRNYDGNHSRFGDVSVFADTGDPNLFTAYASKDSGTGDLLLVVVNKNPDFDYDAQIQFTDFVPQPAAAVYQVSAANPTVIVKEPDLDKASANTRYVFPAHSATLLRFSPRNR